MAVLNKSMTPYSIRFIDDDMTTIEVTVEQEDSPGNYMGFIVRTEDPSDEDYLQLLKWKSLEDMQKDHESNRKQRLEWDEKIQNYNLLQEEINDLRQKLENKTNWISKNKGSSGGRVKTVYKDQDIIEVLNKQMSKEELFAMKIQIFEQEKVRGSQDKVAKSKIRKAQSALEILAAAAPMLLAEETQEENSE